MVDKNFFFFYWLVKNVPILLVDKKMSYSYWLIKIHIRRKPMRMRKHTICLKFTMGNSLNPIIHNGLFKASPSARKELLNSFPNRTQKFRDRISVWQNIKKKNLFRWFFEKLSSSSPHLIYIYLYTGCPKKKFKSLMKIFSISKIYFSKIIFLIG